MSFINHFIPLQNREIYECQKCHNMTCGECVGSLPQCPMCRQDFKEKPPVRNLLAERIVNSVWFDHAFSHHTEDDILSRCHTKNVLVNIINPQYKHSVDNWNIQASLRAYPYEINFAKQWLNWYFAHEIEGPVMCIKMLTRMGSNLAVRCLKRKKN